MPLSELTMRIIDSDKGYAIIKTDDLKRMF